MHLYSQRKRVSIKVRMGFKIARKIFEIFHFSIQSVVATRSQYCTHFVKLFTFCEIIHILCIFLCKTNKGSYEVKPLNRIRSLQNGLSAKHLTEADASTR